MVISLSILFGTYASLWRRGFGAIEALWLCRAPVEMRSTPGGLYNGLAMVRRAVLPRGVEGVPWLRWLNVYRTRWEWRLQLMVRGDQSMWQNRARSL